MIPRIGIELEYMIVDRTSGNVRPIADELLLAQAGEITGEVEVGAYCWSNELVLHVVELKTNGPVETLAGVAEGFQQQIRQINAHLARWNAQLLPTAMHPWMEPLRETRVWPHDNGEVYAAFDRIFGCQGHGWSNLQSMHLNLPFENDESFARLHAAIRLVLPLLPALAASSPLIEGRTTGRLDNRLDVYRTNCAKIPSLTADVIPEPVFTPGEYQERILQKLYRDLRPHDQEGILQHEWVNARGAIARFDRDTIEIRLIDVQESPVADLAIAALVWATIEALMTERWADLKQQQSWAVEPLNEILLDTITEGDHAVIRDSKYLACFGGTKPVATAGQIWRAITSELLPDIEDKLSDTGSGALATVLEQGPLARRIMHRLGAEWTRADVQAVYHQLGTALAEGHMFE